MTILQSGIAQAAGTTGYQIARSLRFNSADSAHLNRTPASAGNRKTWTYSTWFKRSSFNSSSQILLDCSTSGTNVTHLRFVWGTAESLVFYNEVGGTANGAISTTPIYRDTSAFYHVVLAVDTTQATASNRVKLYVNGSQVTALDSASYPTQNADTMVNTTNQHRIGNGIGYLSSNYFNGYMAETRFIDGQQLDATSFGEFDANTGVWVPKAYTGTYGTNGFWLKFDDNSGTTSTTLGKDSSGNGNNWTPNNFSVTAGVGNDSLVDSPTNYGTDTGAGGEVRGNYCTLNPLTTSAGTYTQGNLRYTGATGWRRSNGTLSVSTGKWYWEVTLGNAPDATRNSSSAYNAFGFGLSTVFDSTTGAASVTDAVVLGDNGYYKNFSGSNTDGGVAFSNGDVLSIAVDLDANTFTFRRNNTQVATGTIGGTAGRELAPIVISYSGSFGVMDCNFGQRPFAYTAPSGFKALCTQNLPTPAVGASASTQANDYFDVSIYTGNDTARTITNGGSFKPDLVWVKKRNAAGNHVLFDAIRGVNKTLYSSQTSAEETATAGTGVTAFASNGVTLGTELVGVTYGSTNALNDTYVMWQWRGNGSSVSNTSGTITSTVSANTTAGISIVTYTGTGANATVGHGLGKAPSMIIIKSRSNALDWIVYHAGAGNTAALFLNGTNAKDTNSAYWQNTTPSSTVFSLGTTSAGNTNGATNVAYCFAEVAGFSKFGSYTGNGATDGPFVYCGFRPRFVMVKRSDTTGDWALLDTARSSNNLSNATLYPNGSFAEDTAVSVDILSNGFKLRGTAANGSGGTFIFAAFAEAPFQYSRAR